jgi:hypothetical protein
VYSRQIDGRNLTLVPSGWTYDSTFVLYYFKRWLPKLSYQDTKWQEWVKKHPDSRIMK